MFHALAIVCDVYFVPSLEKVSEVRTKDASNVTENKIALDIKCSLSAQKQPDLCDS